MKKASLVCFILCVCLLACGQVPAPDNTDTLRQIVALKDRIEKQDQRIQKLEKYLSENNLTTSINTAEAIIAKQNSLINGFGVIYTVITVLVVVIGLLIYFFNIRPLIHQANDSVIRSENTIERLNGRMDNFNQFVDDRLERQFSAFENKVRIDKINQIIIDLCGNYPHQKKIALEAISSLPLEEIASQHIYKLFDFLDHPNNSDPEKIPIVELLIQKDTPEIKIFLKHWSNLKPDNYRLKQILVKYYCDNGFSNYLTPVTNFIITHVTPHIEFATISSFLSSYGIAGIVALINHAPLVTGLDNYNKEQICKHLNSYKTMWGIEKAIDECLLCESVRKSTST
jgi:hypothetical protein